MSKELIDRVRTFEIDHKPDGWPAIRMRDISALADALEEAERKLAVAREALRDIGNYASSEAYAAVIDATRTALAQIGEPSAGN